MALRSWALWVVGAQEDGGHGYDQEPEDDCIEHRVSADLSFDYGCHGLPCGYDIYGSYILQQEVV